jgi:hypothetical protein
MNHPILSGATLIILGLHLLVSAARWACAKRKPTCSVRLPNGWSFLPDSLVVLMGVYLTAERPASWQVWLMVVILLAVIVVLALRMFWAGTNNRPDKLFLFVGQFFLTSCFAMELVSPSTGGHWYVIVLHGTLLLFGTALIVYGVMMHFAHVRPMQTKPSVQP